jgi:hypothetical protein
MTGMGMEVKERRTWRNEKLGDYLYDGFGQAWKKEWSGQGVLLQTCFFGPSSDIKQSSLEKDIRRRADSTAMARCSSGELML